MDSETKQLFYHQSTILLNSIAHFLSPFLLERGGGWIVSEQNMQEMYKNDSLEK